MQASSQEVILKEFHTGVKYPVRVTPVHVVSFSASFTPLRSKIPVDYIFVSHTNKTKIYNLLQ